MGICEIFYTRATREGPFLRDEIGLVGGPLRFLCGVHLYSDTSPLCPSCRQVPETCSHILHCPHEGRVEALHTTISMLDKWMKNNTDLDLQECIYQFSMGRGGLLMEEICIENGYDERYKVMARAQDSIGWRRFMEGMVCKEIRAIQLMHSSVTGL